MILNEIRKIKVTVYPTRIKVENYQKGFSSALEKYLSVWDRIYFKYSYHAYIYDEEKEIMIFPAGINIPLLIQSLKNHGEVDFQDYRLKYDNFKKDENYDITMNFKPRDLLQTEAINFLNYKGYNEPDCQKLLSLNTGEGKTFCSLKSIIDRNLIPLIFVSNNKLKEQWVDKIKEYTSVEDDRIFIFQGKSSIKKFLNMDDEAKDKIKFFIVLYRTLKNFINEDRQGFDNLITSANIGVKVFDEAHLDFKSLSFIDMMIDLPSIYLSATPERSNKFENQVFNNIFYQVPKFSSNNITKRDKKLIPDRYHNVVMVRHTSKPTEVDKADFIKASAKKGLDINHYCKYLMDSDIKQENFFDLVFEILNEVIMKDDVKKTVIMFKQKAMIEGFYTYLYNKIGEEGIKFLKCIRYHEDVSKTEKDKLMDSNLILTTDLSLGVGVDIPGLKALLNTIPLTSESKIIQIMGRLRYIKNEDLFYYDLVDHGFEKLVTQANNRLNKVYKKKAVSIIDCNLKSRK